MYTVPKEEKNNMMHSMYEQGDEKKMKENEKMDTEMENEIEKKMRKPHKRILTRKKIIKYNKYTYVFICMKHINLFQINSNENKIKLLHNKYERDD